MAKYPKTLCIGDVHAPFHLRASLGLVYDVARDRKPDIIVQEGDLYDFLSWSRFPRSYDVLTPLQEWKAARKTAELMWAHLRKLCPRAKLYQLKGNHDDRAAKRLLEKAPEFESLTKLDEMWSFDGVETMPDSREELIIKGVVHMHGYRQFGAHVVHNKMNTVTGHLHRGGVAFYRLGGRTLFELNAGYIGNPKSRALSYAQQRRFQQQTQGCGWIDEFCVPSFIPFPNP